MKTTKKRHKKIRSKRRQRDKPSTVILSGGCVNPATCPVCADLATQGDVLAMTRDGQTVRIDPTTLKTITVSVRGDRTTWPILDTETCDVELPEHCSLEGLITYLNYRDPRFAKLDVVVGSVGGDTSNLSQVLQDGDDVTISRSSPPFTASIE